MTKSIVKKGIARKIKTAQFEQLDISVEIEEEIIWETEKERIIATRDVSRKLLDDFTSVYNSAVERLGVDRCIGVVNVEGSKDKTDSTIDFDFE